MYSVFFYTFLLALDSFFSSLIIVSRYSRLISLCISVIIITDILLSVLFNLLLANITILLCFFFLFRVVFNNFFTILIVIENVKLKLSLAIPTGNPITVANEAIEMLPLVADKTIKDLSK